MGWPTTAALAKIVIKKTSQSQEACVLNRFDQVKSSRLRCAPAPPLEIVVLSRRAAKTGLARAVPSSRQFLTTRSDDASKPHLTCCGAEFADELHFGFRLIDLKFGFESPPGRITNQILRLARASQRHECLLPGASRRGKAV